MTAIQDPERLAAEAKSLQDNEVLKSAISALLDEARDKLTTVDPTDADAIREHQATVRAISGLMFKLKSMIFSGQPRHQPGGLA